MKVRVPINERLASKIAGEHKALRGFVEEQRTVFYGDDGEIAFEKVELGHPENPYKLVSYYAFMEEYKQKEGE